MQLFSFVNCIFIVVVYIFPKLPCNICMGFPGGSDGKESACNEGDLGLIPGLGRFPGESMAIHSSILAWRIPMTNKPGSYGPWGHKELDMTERLN